MLVLAGAAGCKLHELHSTSVLETSIVGRWEGNVTYSNGNTQTIRMVIESDDETNLTGTTIGYQVDGTLQGTLTGTALDIDFDFDHYYQSGTGTFVGQRVSIDRLEGTITYDVVTLQQPMSIVFHKVERANQFP